MRNPALGTVVSIALLAGLSGCETRDGSSLGLSSDGSKATPGGTGERVALLDGSFEQGGLGWQLEGASAVEVGAGAYHGTHVLRIDPGSSSTLKTGRAAVRVPTEVGREYRLTFAYQTGFDTGAPTLTTVIGGESPGHVASVLRFFSPGIVREEPSRNGWQEEELTFFAEQPTTRVQIGPFARWRSDIGWGRIWIDYVRMEALQTTRTLGRDVSVRASLPSLVTVGEEVELTVSLSGTPKRGRHSGGTFDTTPIRHPCELQVTSDDSAAILPQGIVFSSEHTRVERVRFGTPGVHRLTLATTDGFSVLSNPVRVESQAPAMRPYWGDLHIHTKNGHADWIGGTGDENYLYARDYADLDFAALAEHFEGPEAMRWMEELQPATERFHEPGRFVTFIGAESFSYQGHTNHYLRGDQPLGMFDSRNRLPSRESQVAALRSRGERALSIPHHFMLLDPADWRDTDHEALRLAEIYSIHGSSEEAGAWWRHPQHVGPAYANSQGARGHDFRAALGRGHRVGVIACSDSHSVQPGLSGLTCVRSPELSRPALWDGLYRRDCYGTSGARILFDFEIAGTAMGGEVRLAPGTPLLARIEVHGQAPIEAVEIVRDGTVVAAASPGTLDYSGTLDLGTFAGESRAYYARVRQRDQHRAWTSPVWIDALQRSNPSIENSGLEYDHGTRTLRVTAKNRGDLPATVDLDLYSSRLEPGFGLVEPSTLNAPALMLRIEPVHPGRVRLFVSLYLTRNGGRAFRLSGHLSVENVASGATRIVADPRGMLRTEGDNSLSWDELLGVEYMGPESLSGQITDFELAIETRPETILRIQPLLDGALVTKVYVGSQLQVAPAMIVLPIGQIAMLPAERHASLSIDAGRSASLTCDDMVPGATYVAVLGLDELESDEEDNSAHLLVPAEDSGYVHWPEFTRVTDGLQVLYSFNEGSGTTVFDRSNVGTPIDLTIANPSAVTWGPGTLGVDAATTLTSTGAAAKLNAAIPAAGALSVEAWVRPANTSQNGPARIVSLSQNTLSRNLTLGQGDQDGVPGDLYCVRLRTTSTSANGTPSVRSPSGSATTEMTHVVFTRAADGQAAFFIDGRVVSTFTSTGSLSTWSPTDPLSLANELTGDRPWLGTFGLVAIYARALTAAEVAQNHQAGDPGDLE